MTRIADALRRARNNSSGGSGGDESRVDDTIQFFAPGQPAVVSPWDIVEDPAADFPDLSLSTHDEERPQERQPRAADAAVSAFAGLPTGERSEKLVISATVTPAIRAQYSKVAAALHDMQRERDIRVLMVISTGSGEGKTLTAANLALTFSEVFEKRVLLIDTDFRKPALHELFGVSNAQGLAHLIDHERARPVVQLTPRFSLLPAGECHDDPTRMFTSERLWAFLEDARARFDWIVVDTAPLDFVPHARLLAPMTDGALLVAMAGKTLYDEIQRAAGTFDPKVLLGVVLNGVSEDTSLATHGYYGSPAPANPTIDPAPNHL